MKKSDYNFYQKSNISGGYIYNTISGSIVYITDSYDWSNLINSKFDLIDSETRNILLKERILRSNQFNELNHLKNLYRNHVYDVSSLHITIMPTDMCNFSCPYCFNSERGNRVMNNETYALIYKYIKSKIGLLKNLVITWFGGEPTLECENILMFMKRLSSLCSIYNVKLISSITTNGYLLSKDIFKYLYESGVKNYQVTIDGIKETHDKTRCTKDKKPTFDIITKNISEIATLNKSYDFNFDIRCNVTKTNYESAKKLIISFLSKYKNDNRFQLYCRPVYFYETDFNEIKQIEDSIYTLYEGIKMQNDLALYMEKLTHNASKKRFFNPMPLPTTNWCSADLQNFLLIGPDGELFFCDTLTSIDNIYGNIEEILNIDNLNKPSYDIFNDSRTEKCMDCKLLPLCYGGCLRNRIHSKAQCYWTVEGIENTFLEYINFLEEDN